MTEYALDVDAGQIVHWLMDDAKSAGRAKLDVRATREYADEPVPSPAEAGIGEDEDVSTLTTVGLLEVRPLESAHRWVMRILIEDVIGPHVPEDESAPEDAEEIDLAAFYRDFISPDSGTAFVSVLSETAEDKHAFDLLLRDIIMDAHRR